MIIFLPFWHFIWLAVTTAVATYFFNASLMAGEFFYAALSGFVLVGNLRSSYRLSQVIRRIEAQLQQKHPKNESK